MKSAAIVLVCVVLASHAGRVVAAGHGGGHGASAPKAPHFNPPPAQHFNPPKSPHANAVNLGGFGGGYMPRYSQPRHSSGTGTGTKSNSTSKTNNNTKLHNLANALQKSSHANQSNHGATQSAAGLANSHSTAVANGALAASSSSSAAGSTGQSKSALTGTAASTSSVSQAPITGTLSLNTAQSGSSINAKPFSLNTTGPNLATTSANLVGTTSATPAGTSTAIAATNTNGLGTTMSTTATPLMSHLNSAYAYPTSIGSGNSRRYANSGYGSRYNSSRSYGNRNNNNSMYFAQMRRLAQLASALNNLRVGSTTNMSHTTRVRSALAGVVFNNGQPPYQAVNQLAMDLVNHLPKRTTPLLNTGQLARDLMIAMNAGGQNMSQIQHAISSAHSVLNMSGVNQQGIQQIGIDMMAVASRGNGANPLAQLQ